MPTTICDTHSARGNDERSRSSEMSSKNTTCPAYAYSISRVATNAGMAAGPNKAVEPRGYDGCGGSAKTVRAILA
eukprot:CAMPEP_0185858270 /NCGR_PEP_ID=MMETSP1354-20130828/29927_1 /TAXON_ID=708628 /ORGANISM="Erythrolobus madagascarensis, Strain CCMP3276" /LENGTH=74 /DNA_ID=CAMNT_0028560551 /DNA_START=592 /DNA_END=813 /DNA_ORIENTATION=+